jgi:hypothetical protein
MNALLISPEGRQRTDPVGQVELLLNQVFLGVFQTEAARSRLGFRHISPQVSFDGLPGWYVWFSDLSGAYLIRVLGSGAPPEPAPLGMDAQTVRLGIYYYPSVEESCFEDFSWPEKILRCGESFDSTGTPSAEGRNSIPASFYLVGWIDLCWCKSRRLLALQAGSSERLRDYRIDGLTVKNVSGEPLELVRPGGCDRNLPGWELTQHLVDKLVLAICFQQRLSPIAALVTAREGYANHLHSEQKAERRTEPGISDLFLATALSAMPIDDPELTPETYVAAARQRLGGEPVACAVGLPPHPEGRARFINPDWWRVKDLPLEPALGCGCCHHDH